jgi:phage tail-like protein
MTISGPLASVGIRLDPPLNYNFVVTMAETTSTGAFLKSAAMSLLGDVIFGGFSECSGLDMAQSDEKLHEGGRNDTELRFPTRTTWTNLTLKRGMSRISQSGWDWLYGFGDGKVKRMDGLVMLLDDHHIPHNFWTFKRAFPSDSPVSSAAPAVVAVGLELTHGLWQLSILARCAGRGVASDGRSSTSCTAPSIRSADALPPGGRTSSPRSAPRWPGGGIRRDRAADLDAVGRRPATLGGVTVSSLVKAKFKVYNKDGSFGTVACNTTPARCPSKSSIRGNRDPGLDAPLRRFVRSLTGP